MSQYPNEGLKRVIGTRSLIASTINLTIGAGIFALPAVVSGQLGTASWLAYVVCAGLLLLMLLCFISLGTKLTMSGGAYAYVEHAFGPYAGFLINILYWFGFGVVADAAVANILVDNLVIIFPVLKNQAFRILVLAAIFSFIGWTNVRGVQKGVRLIEINALAKLIPLTVLIVVGAFAIDPGNFNWTYFPSVKTLGEASLILFFAFGGGAETVLNASGEIRDPVRTIPRGILTGAFLVFIFYLAIHLIAQGVLGADLSLYPEAPLSKVAQHVIGPAGVTLLVIGAAISCFGLVSGDILASSRLLFAAARDGSLPKILLKVHPRYATPYWSIIVYTAIGFVLSISGGFNTLAPLASAALLLIYIGVIFAAFKLRKLNRENSFNIPILVPVLSLFATGWFLSSLKPKEIWMTVIFLVITSVVFVIARALKTKNPATGQDL